MAKIPGRCPWRDCNGCAGGCFSRRRPRRCRRASARSPRCSPRDCRRQSLWPSLRSLVYPSGIAEAYAAFEHFDLADKLWDRVDRLSGGERQRVGLARALLAPASLMVDRRAALGARSDPRQAGHRHTDRGGAPSSGVTLIVTLHQVNVAARFPRIVGLRDGELAFDLPAAEVTPRTLGEIVCPVRT